MRKRRLAYSKKKQQKNRIQIMQLMYEIKCL